MCIGESWMLELGGERTAPTLAGAGPSTKTIKKVRGAKPSLFHWQSPKTRTSAGPRNLNLLIRSIDNLQADYNANALAKAKTYQQTMNMSPAAIQEQLTSEAD